MAKRKLSARQKAALAKGRAALRRLRGGVRKIARKITRKARRKARVSRTYINRAAEPLIIKEGTMAGKKRRSSKRKATRKTRHVYVHGSTGSKKVRRHRRRSHGLAGGLGRLNIMSTVGDMAGLAAGAVGASYVAKMVPVANAKVKALVPIALGLGLGMTRFGRGKMGKAASEGAIAVGTLALVKSFFPTLPLLSGADDAEGVAGAIDALPSEEKALLGLTVQGDGMGFDTDMAGVIDAPLSPSNVD